jgi:hypothetical protein
MYHVIGNSPVSRRVRKPRWVDLRLVAGVVLVLGSLLIGARVIAAADHTERVWAAAHDLAPGIVLQPSDLQRVAVRLPGATDGYLPVSSAVAGQILNRQIDAGELLPRSAIGPTAQGTTITIPLGADNAPKISSGQRITVWVSTKQCPSATVLADVAVQDAQASHDGGFAAGGGEDVIVRIDAQQAQRVIQALALDSAVLRAGILDGASPSAAASLPDLATCATAGGS